MCRASHAEGVRLSVALAHQNDQWPAVTPDRIRDAAAGLADRLRRERLEFAVFPTAETLAAQAVAAAVVVGSYWLAREHARSPVAG